MKCMYVYTYVFMHVYNLTERSYEAYLFWHACINVWLQGCVNACALIEACLQTNPWDKHICLSKGFVECKHTHM